MRKVATVQGIFYITTGVWPLISMKTFEKVTGPKTDDWLVKTVGLLIAVSGVALLQSGFRSRASPDIAIIGVGEAISLGSVSLIYSSTGRISKVYMLDTLLEYTLAFLWYLAIRSRKSIDERQLSTDLSEERRIA